MSFFSEKPFAYPGACLGRLKHSLRVCLLSLLAFLISDRSAAQSPNPAHYKLEAAFLFNFVQFVEWPSSAFDGPDAPFTIGVLGKDPFGNTLDEIVRGEVVKGHALRVARYRSVEDIKNCQILFISASEENRLSGIFAELRGRPVLTVGESEGFARRGGVVRFLTDQPKIRLRINIDALAESKLTASSKLLRLAELVHSDLK